jgi:hypothetical protein
VNQVGVAQVVQAAGAQDLRTSLEPDGLGEGDAAILGQQLGGHAPQSSQHGPAGVDDLNLAVPGDPSPHLSADLPHRPSLQ